MVLVQLIIVIVPIAMAVVFVLVLLLMFRPWPPRAAAPLGQGQGITLHALLIPDVRPGTLISVDEWTAAAGRITLSAYDLTWQPEAGAVPPWRVPLAHVRVVERPPTATGRLVLAVEGRFVALVLDPKKRPNRIMTNTVADLRQARTGAWFADVLEATARQASARWSPPVRTR